MPKKSKRESREKPVTILEWLASLPHSYWTWHPNGLVGIRGVYRGRAVVIEVGPIYPERFYQLGRMRKAGGFVAYLGAKPELKSAKWFIEVIEEVCMKDVRAN